MILFYFFFWNGNDMYIPHTFSYHMEAIMWDLNLAQSNPRTNVFFSLSPSSFLYLWIGIVVMFCIQQFSISYHLNKTELDIEKSHKVFHQCYIEIGIDRVGVVIIISIRFSIVWTTFKLFDVMKFIFVSIIFLWFFLHFNLVIAILCLGYIQNWFKYNASTRSFRIQSS